MTATRNEIRFLLNDREERLSEVRSSDTLLDHLRLTRRLRGTKEGCAEGDCGACTVLVGRRTQGGLVYEPVNACIRLMGSLDLCHVVTVEHLAGSDGALHPVQQAMVDFHGSQCGFCTPGIVMSLYGLWMRAPEPDRAAVEEALQGNLCRCTGYEPIIEAALAAGRYGSPQADRLAVERESVLARLAAMDDGARVEIADGRGPAGGAGERRRPRRGARGVAGGDGGGGVDRRRALDHQVHAVDLAGGVHRQPRRAAPASRWREDGVTLGAGVSYDEFQSVLDAEFPHLSDFWRRIGGWQVRAMGTVGGNIANGSPIGDTPPALIAHGGDGDAAEGGDAADAAARGVLHRLRQAGPGARRVRGVGLRAAAAAGLVERGLQDHQAARRGHLGGGLRHSGDRRGRDRAAWRGSPSAAWRRRRSALRRPRRRCVGQPWTAQAIAEAQGALAEDFAPISDWRASAEYRGTVAQNLLRRFFLESAGESAQLVREVA